MNYIALANSLIKQKLALHLHGMVLADMGTWGHGDMGTWGHEALKDTASHNLGNN